MKKFLTLTLLIFFISGCGTQGVIPEMKEFTGAFGAKEKLMQTADKYAAAKGIVPESLYTCDMEKPNITKTEKKDNRILYTAEVKVGKCEKSETATGTIRIFEIGWENGKIVSFEWHGPKGGKVEY